MLRLRRLYFYLVLYISLSMLLAGLATLIRVLLEQLLGASSSGIAFGLFGGREQFREQTAFGTALVAIGLPAWLLHWTAVRGWLVGPAGREERGSGLRRLYLYGVLLTTALTAYLAARDLLAHLLGLALGVSRGAETLVGLAQTLPYVLIGGLFWLYHWRLAAADRAAVDEVGASATLRRWYVYGLAALGVVPLMVNLAFLGRQVWIILFDRGALASLGPPASLETVAESSATALVGLVVWLAHRGWSEAAVATPLWYGENERHSILRKVYLYGLVLGTVGWALANASRVLEFALTSLLGVAPERVGGQPPLVALGQPLAAILVFGAFWAFFRRAVDQEARAEAEVGRQAGVRRVYYYLVSAVALALAAASLAGLLRLAADLLLQAAPLDAADSRRALAADLSRLLIALPVWLLHWRSVQASLSGPRGEAEIRASSRRWYLYLVAFAGLMVLLVNGARLIYELVLLLLGAPLEGESGAELAHLLLNALVAAGVLWYHWWLVLRADLAALRQLGADQVAVAVIAGLDRAAAEQLQQFARESLDRARVRLYWTDEAHARQAVDRLSQAAPERRSPQDGDPNLAG
jgi:hypothetical protein